MYRDRSSSIRAYAHVKYTLDAHAHRHAQPLACLAGCRERRSACTDSSFLLLLFLVSQLVTRQPTNYRCSLALPPVFNVIHCEGRRGKDREGRSEKRQHEISDAPSKRRPPRILSLPFHLAAERASHLSPPSTLATSRSLRISRT